MGRAVPKPTIVVLEGDQTGQELLVEALRVLEPDVVGFSVDIERYDLSLEKRRETNNAIVHEAAAAMKRTKLGLKAATITPEAAGDVGSPNAILRRAIDGKVIVRTGRRIPGVRPVAGIHAPISVVRMAVGDAYGAKEWREMEGEEEVAYRTERIERSVCRMVSEYAFFHARRTGARVNIVHITSPEGVAMVHRARALGVEATAETCPTFRCSTAPAVTRAAATVRSEVSARMKPLAPINPIESGTSAAWIRAGQRASLDRLSKRLT